MTAMNEPDPDSITTQPGEEQVRTPRRRRQPVLAVLAIIGILLLVFAVGIFGGIF